MRETLRKKITRELIKKFAEATDDYNPIHYDVKFARDSIFGRIIAHGILGAGLISAVIGTKLPGPGNVYLNQELRFLAPVFPGDEIIACAEIIELDEAKKLVKLATWCENQNGKIVIEGKGLVLFRQ